MSFPLSVIPLGGGKQNNSAFHVLDTKLRRYVNAKNILS